MARVKKTNPSRKRDISHEYDFRGGVRGKYVKDYAEGSNVVPLAPDVVKAFPDSDSVNEALRLLIKASERRSSASRRRTAGRR